LGLEAEFGEQRGHLPRRVGHLLIGSGLRRGVQLACPLPTGVFRLRRTGVRGVAEVGREQRAQRGVPGLRFGSGTSDRLVHDARPSGAGPRLRPAADQFGACEYVEVKSDCAHLQAQLAGQRVRVRGPAAGEQLNQVPSGGRSQSVVRRNRASRRHAAILLRRPDAAS